MRRLRLTIASDTRCKEALWFRACVRNFQA